MARKKGFNDGLKSVTNTLINSRKAQATNQFAGGSKRVADVELRSIYKTGIGQRIVSLKSGYALNETIKFAAKQDEKWFNENLYDDVRSASEKMLTYGRSIIILFRKGDILSKPFNVKEDNPHQIQRRLFEGENVTAHSPITDLMDDRFDKPMTYQVAGETIHWSRVIDFTYVTPPRKDLPLYRFGGISEFELIYAQLVNDAIVERSTGTMLEKSSSMFYKIKGWRDALRGGQDSEIIEYFTKVEELRGIYGAGIIDSEDAIEAVNQALQNLAETDMISLRRLAMVTGIPVSWLVGENVKGLNATGDNERQILQDTIETMQRTYLLRPINELLTAYGRDPIKFKDNQGETPTVRLKYETDAIANAKVLNEIGEDANAYLIEKGVIIPSKFEMFEADIDDAEDEEITPEELAAVDETTNKNPA